MPLGFDDLLCWQNELTELIWGHRRWCWWRQTRELPPNSGLFVSLGFGLDHDTSCTTKEGYCLVLLWWYGSMVYNFLCRQNTSVDQEWIIDYHQLPWEQGVLSLYELLRSMELNELAQASLSLGWSRQSPKTKRRMPRSQSCGLLSKQSLGTGWFSIS